MGYKMVELIEFNLWVDISTELITLKLLSTIWLMARTHNSSIEHEKKEPQPQNITDGFTYKPHKHFY